MVGEKPSRRKVLRGIGVGASVLALSDVAGAQSIDTDEDVNIREVEPKSQDIAKAESTSVMREGVVSDLSESAEKEAGFSPSPSESISVSVETDSDDLNEKDPSILHIPLKPSDGAYHSDNGGVLLAMTIQHEGERKPLVSLAVTREMQGNFTSKFLGWDDQVSMKVFGSSNEGAGLIEEHFDTPYRNQALHTPVSSTEADHFKTTVNGVGCWTCMTVMQVACASFSYVGTNACLSAALSSSAFGPWAFTAATAFCAYIVANANVLSCAAGPPAICASAGACP